MNTLSSNMIYAISNIFGAFVLYKMMGVYYEFREYNKKINMFSYVLYFIITTIIQILFDGSILSYAVYIILIPLFTLNYYKYWKHNQNALLIILGIYLAIEAMSYFSIRLFDFDNKEIIVFAVSKMAMFIAMVILKKIIEKDKCKWQLFAFTLFVPIGTSYIFYLLTFSSSKIIPIAGSVLIYSLNICVFVLYEKVSRIIGDKSYAQICDSQTMDMVRLKSIVVSYQEECKTLQKDTRLNLQRLAFFLQHKKYDKALEYCKSGLEIKPYLFNEVYSGNKELDNILNFELSSAIKIGAKVLVEAILPREMEKELVNDLHSALKCLIQNAVIKSLEVAVEQRRVKVLIDYKEHSVSLTVGYAFNGKTEDRKGIRFYDAESSKEDGLEIYCFDEMKKVLKKYNTYLTVMDLITLKDFILKIEVPYELA